MSEQLVLRERQAATLEKVREAWRSGATNVLIQAPCGMGKTEMATAMLQAAYEKGSRGAFICDRLSLIGQTHDRFGKYGLPHGVIQGQHEHHRPNERIQLCSIQTLHARQTWPEMDVLIGDEIHVLPKTLAKKLGARECRAIGLTATPFTKGLGKYFDAVVNAATTNQLIQEGLLTPFIVFQPSVPDMEGVKVNSKGEWDEREAESRVLPIVGDVVENYQKHGNGKKFICFAVSTNHADELQRSFLAAGIQVGLYTYLQSDDVKAEMVAEHRKPDSSLAGLISIDALSRGYDVASIEVLILARPLRKSLTTHIQMLGRVLRTSEGKTEAIVLDHANNCERFWEETEAYMEYGVQELDDGSKKEKKKPDAKEKKPRLCPRCKHLHGPRPTCPRCGHEYPRKSRVEVVAGELIRAGERASVPIDVKIATYAQLLAYQNEKKYKSGWAANSYRARFHGEWPPRGISPEPVPPSDELRRWIRSQMIRFFKGKQKAGR